MKNRWDYWYLTDRQYEDMLSGEALGLLTGWGIVIAVIVFIVSLIFAGLCYLALFLLLFMGIGVLMGLITYSYYGVLNRNAICKGTGRKEGLKIWYVQTNLGKTKPDKKCGICIKILRNVMKLGFFLGKYLALGIIGAGLMLFYNKVKNEAKTDIDIDAGDMLPELSEWTLVSEKKPEDGQG